MYQWIKDPVRGWVFVPEWMAEMVMCEQRNRGSVHASDRQAYSRIHSAAPASSVVRVVDAPRTVTVGDPPVKPSGWVDPLPLKPPPGVNLADRIVDAQDQKDRVEAAFRRRLK
jgi:hypothetical protein